MDKCKKFFLTDCKDFYANKKEKMAAVGSVIGRTSFRLVKGCNPPYLIDIVLSERSLLKPRMRLEPQQEENNNISPR